MKKTFNLEKDEKDTLSRKNLARMVAKDQYDAMNQNIETFLSGTVFRRLNLENSPIKGFEINFETGILTVDFLTEEEAKQLEKEAKKIRENN